jgi:F-box/WD-40 domain protein 7
LKGNCNRGDTCNFLHAHTTAPDVEMKTQLLGHEKAIRAIVLPEGHTQLYTGSQDESVRVWDCGTGQCTNVAPMGGDVGALICAAGWLFVGLPNEVKVWNMATLQQQSLGGPKGQVHALAVTEEGLLFAGTQDGSILVWRFSPATNQFEPLASMLGHTGPVVTLMLIANRLYSGSMDKTIRVWEIASVQCVQTLEGHTNVVMDLLCWDSFLLSCSLDGTVKIWAVNAAGQLELAFTYPEEDTRSVTLTGALKMCGCSDRAEKPVLLVSHNDNTVRLYDLPTFTERGQLYSREEVRALQVGPNSLVFTGDSSGEVKVWSWTDAPAEAVAE